MPKAREWLRTLAGVRKFTLEARAAGIAVVAGLAGGVVDIVGGLADPVAGS